MLPRIPTNLEERTAQRSVVATFVGCARPINKNNVCPFSPFVYATMVYEYVNVESIRHELWQPIGKFIDVLIRSAIPTKQVNRAGLYLCFKFLRGGGKLNFVLNVGPTMFTRDIQGKRGQTVR